MSSLLAGVIAIVALFVAVLALVFAIHRQPVVASNEPRPEPRRTAGDVQLKPPVSEESERGRTVKEELRALRKDLGGLRLDLSHALRHLALVRYDAFGESGGQLSWSLALLDDHGDGVVITSINGRSDARTYAKNVRGYRSDVKLSPEEEQVLDSLRPRVSEEPEPREHPAPLRH